MLGLLSYPMSVGAERVKDLATVAGVRENQLLGYGLVVGLEGTGDKTGQVRFTEQSLRSMLSQFGVTIPPNIKIQPKNVAAVSVQATMPPFSKPGQRIDVTISSLGNASSLRGGTLLMTPLRGGDGQVYAIAQGNALVGGVSAEGADGSSVQTNITSVGRIPNGATVERSVGTGFNDSKEITLNLNTADFTTATRLEKAINETLGSPFAQAQDAVTVVVQGPLYPSERVAFISALENIEVLPAQTKARIIVNSRTGTIVIGENVRVMPAAVAHGNITVTISETVNVNQPAPLANGETAITPETTVKVEESEASLLALKQSVTLNDVVRSLNQVGAATSDLIAILQALKLAGALRGQLVII
ncbi:flagellar biosynthesis protein FlgI [Chromatiales bacterium (ex Bugula neritina AB1)]|nr:flagellar biosynthesis protein FlgI [Chromatiales bacterium (ex Bugula neritina AB1)]